MGLEHLPRLSRNARVTSARTPDGVVYTLEAPGAAQKRFSERVWHALCLLESAQTLDGWFELVNDPRISKERLAALLQALGAAGLLEQRAADDVERTQMHVIPMGVASTPSFELFSGEGAGLASGDAGDEASGAGSAAIIVAGSVQTRALDRAVADPQIGEVTESDADARTRAVDEVLSEPEALASRRRRAARRAAAGIAAVGALVAVLAIVRMPLVLTYELDLQPIEKRLIRPAIVGVVKSIEVEEGGAVAAGAIVARLENADKELSLSRNTALLEKARAELALRERGSRPEEIEKAHAAISGLKRELAIASGRAARTRDLVSRGLAPAGELDAARTAVASLQGQLEAAKAELRILESGPRPEELAMLSAEAAALTAQVEAERRSVEGLILRSPIDGLVVTPKLKDRIGSRLEPGEAFIEVIRTDKMFAQILVAERDLDVLKPGLAVRAKVTAFPTEAFTGEIVRVAQQVELKEGLPIVRVDAILENADHRLVPKMTGFAEISAEPRSLLSLLTRRLVRWVRVRFIV